MCARAPPRPQRGRPTTAGSADTSRRSLRLCRRSHAAHQARTRGSPPDAFDVEKLPVIDDWPEKVPITEAEIQVFERWFADVFDEMFGPLPTVPGLTKLSSSDNKKP